MKTHDLARTFLELARILKSGPNIKVEQLATILAQKKPAPTQEALEIGLSTLVELSRVDKQQWLALINEYGFPIRTRPRDASRDILGKLLRYLETHPEARETLKKSATRRGGQASPALMKALATLLKD